MAQATQKSKGLVVCGKLKEKNSNNGFQEEGYIEIQRLAQDLKMCCNKNRHEISQCYILFNKERQNQRVKKMTVLQTIPVTIVPKESFLQLL